MPGAGALTLSKWTTTGLELSCALLLEGLPAWGGLCVLCWAAVHPAVTAKNCMSL